MSVLIPPRAASSHSGPSSSLPAGRWPAVHSTTSAASGGGGSEPDDAAWKWMLYPHAATSPLASAGVMDATRLDGTTSTPALASAASAALRWVSVFSAITVGPPASNTTRPPCLPTTLATAAASSTPASAAPTTATVTSRPPAAAWAFDSAVCTLVTSSRVRNGMACSLAPGTSSSRAVAPRDRTSQS